MHLFKRNGHYKILKASFNKYDANNKYNTLKTRPKRVNKISV